VVVISFLVSKECYEEEKMEWPLKGFDELQGPFLLRVFL
jgi:hypothetical protein